MRNLEKDAIEMAARREAILREGFRLFSEESIESVKMTDVAKAAGIGIATLYRYYSTKPELVLAISVDQWSKVIEEEKRSLALFDPEDKTAAQCLTYFLDRYIHLFLKHKPLLRFNQNFNIYVIHEKLEAKQMESYIDQIESIKELYEIIYEKAQIDGTVKTDMSEEKMFSYILHVMLAVIVRYAQGLVYNGKTEDDMLEELELLKSSLLSQFVN